MKRKFQRILIVFSCGPDGGALRTTVSRDDGACKLNKKRLPRHKILDIQTQLPPPTVCPKGVSHVQNKRPLWTGTILLWCTGAYHRWAIKAISPEVAGWPFCCSVWFIITLCTLATALGQHLGINQLSSTAKTLWSRSNNTSLTWSTKSRPVRWCQLNNTFSFFSALCKHLWLKVWVPAAPSVTLL